MMALATLFGSLAAHAQPPGNKPPAAGSPWPGLDSIPPWPAPTLAEVLSNEAFAPFRLSEDAPASERLPGPVDLELLQQRLRQRLQSRWQPSPQSATGPVSRDVASQLTPIPPQRDVIDLKGQRSSWLALIAGDYQTAAASLHDALLRGSPAMLGQLHRIAGSEQDYEIGYSNLAEAAQAGEAGKAEQFLLIYHAAVRGDKPIARTLLMRLDQPPRVHLDAIVRLRLRQLLEH